MLVNVNEAYGRQTVHYYAADISSALIALAIS